MNRRNAEFIMPYNKRRYYPLVDDKRKTKSLAQQHGIPVPDLYGAIEIEHDIRGFKETFQQWNDFVVKPANGSGGNGIVVIKGRTAKGAYRKNDESQITDAELGHHLSNILSGMYSLGGTSDIALVEYRVKFDPAFQSVCYQGVPDIRTIVFRGVPVMAMVRLPTRDSDGKANLHQGAVGAGIHLDSGVTTLGVHKNAIVTLHPDTGLPIAGLKIPSWAEILHLAAQCHTIAPLDYMGVDIVLDETRGPLMLELNARPGLNIQLCNKQGLLPVLNKMKSISTIPAAVEDRVHLALKISREITKG